MAGVPSAKRQRADTTEAGAVPASMAQASHFPPQFAPQQYAHPVPQQYFPQPSPQQYASYSAPQQYASYPAPQQCAPVSAPQQQLPVRFPHQVGASSLPQRAPPMDESQKRRLHGIVSSLSPSLVAALLLNAASMDSTGMVAQSIEHQHQMIIDAEKARVIDFDHYSKAAWHELNQDTRGWGGADEFGRVGDVETAIEKMLSAILRATKEHSSFGTKKSAVETMRKIFKSLMLGNDQIAHEVRNTCYGWDAMFVAVFNRMTDLEKARLALEDDGAWAEKFREVVKLANEYCVMEKLGEPLDELDSYWHEDSEEYDEEEEEGDEDEEDEGAGTAAGGMPTGGQGNYPLPAGAAPAPHVTG